MRAVVRNFAANPCGRAQRVLVWRGEMRMRTTVIVTLGLLLAGRAVGAQADSTMLRTGTGAGTIVLRVDVSAREVRFAKQPEIRVTLVGGTLDSVRVLERRNLPERVAPGTTYRDVYIAVEVIGKLHAECLAASLSSRGMVSAILDDIRTGESRTATWGPGGCRPASESPPSGAGARPDSTRSP